jgi:hypothetical protein
MQKEEKHKLSIMKKVALLTSILLCISIFSSAQKDTLQRIRIYKTWITLGSGATKQGLLYQTKDSSVVIANSLSNKGSSVIAVDLSELVATNIYFIKARREGNVTKGVLIGATAGILAGVIIGLVSEPDVSNSFGTFVPEIRALGGGILGVLPGILIGGMISSVRIKIPINGSINKFNKEKEQLRKYSYLH